MSSQPLVAPNNQLLNVHTVVCLPQGDITLKLFPEECPHTVENFTTHAKNGYYDNVIFHRVIKGFMLQTGDPLGESGHQGACWAQGVVEFNGAEGGGGRLVSPGGGGNVMHPGGGGA
jgi:hypothetical protein